MAERQAIPNSANGTYVGYHDDTPEAMKNEKRALLAMMAEHGTEGQAELQKQYEASKQTRGNSIEMAAARGAQVHAPGTLQAQLTNNYDLLNKGLMDSNQSQIISHGREMDRIAAANAAYLDQVSGASELNRDMLAAQLEQASSGRGGGGGGGGRGGGGSSYGGSPYSSPTGPEDWTLMGVTAFQGDQGITGTKNQTLKSIEDLYATGNMTRENAEELMLEVERNAYRSPWMLAAEQAQADYEQSYGRRNPNPTDRGARTPSPSTPRPSTSAWAGDKMPDPLKKKPVYFRPDGR